MSCPTPNCSDQTNTDMDFGRGYLSLVSELMAKWLAAARRRSSRLEEVRRARPKATRALARSDGLEEGTLKP